MATDFRAEWISLADRFHAASIDPHHTDQAEDAIAADAGRLLCASTDAGVLEAPDGFPWQHQDDSGNQIRGLRDNPGMLEFCHLANFTHLVVAIDMLSPDGFPENPLVFRPGGANSRKDYRARAARLADVCRWFSEQIEEPDGPVPDGFRYGGRIISLKRNPHALLCRIWKCRPTDGVRKLHIGHVKDDVFRDSLVSPQAIRATTSRIHRAFKKAGVPIACGSSLSGCEDEKHVWLRDERNFRL